MLTGRCSALKKLLFLPVEQELLAPYIGHYRSYGIAAVCLSFSRCEIPAFVSDVSTDFSFVSHLADLFTRNRLDPLHLFNVIEDSI